MSEVIAKDQNFLLFLYFRAYPTRAVKWFSWVRQSGEPRVLCTWLCFLSAHLLLTCCVIMTGSSVDAAGDVFYQLVCAPVVKRRMRGTGPLENSGAISSSGPNTKTLPGFLWHPIINPSDTLVNGVNGRLLHKDHLHNSAV